MRINGEDCIQKEIHVQFGHPFRFDAKVKLSGDVKSPVFNIYFHDLGLAQIAQGRRRYERMRSRENELSVRFEMPGIFLNPNMWRFSFSIYDSNTNKNVLTLLYICKVIVKGEDIVNAPLQLTGNWSFSN